MIHYVLACVLWAKPDVQLVEVPVDEYGMANMQNEFNEFTFQASIIEENMNSVKITDNKSASSAEAYAPMDPQLKSLTIRLQAGEQQASLDCEIKIKSQDLKGK